MTPDAKPLHQQVQKNIERLLHAACEGSGYICNGNTNIRLTPHDMPSPDVFIVSWPAWRRAVHNNEYVNVPPLLVIEILSPGQDVSEKRDVYLTAGVDEVWIVDPAERTVIAWTGQWRGHGYQTEEKVSLPSPLKGELSVADFFAGLPDRE